MDIAEFQRSYPFPFDGFQRDACRALGEGRSVLVCAPTGAGKTVVGECAVWLALQTGRKCFVMEIDALYCDVIVTRYEQFTGQKAAGQPAA